MYILLTQTRTVSCYMTDPSFRQGGRPTTNKTATVFNYNNNVAMSPRGPQCQDGWMDGRTDGLTDWPTNSEVCNIAKKRIWTVRVCPLLLIISVLSPVGEKLAR